MGIVTLATFKTYVRDEAAGLNDTTLQGYVDAASQGLNNACGRQWVVASGGATARSFQPSGWSQTLFINDCTTITSVVDNGSTLVAGTDYQAEPLNHLSDAGETVPYYRLYKPRTYWISNSGFASVVVTRGCGNELDRASTVTPGSADPSVAVTLPLIVPVCWPNAVTATRKSARLRHSLRRCMRLPPLISLKIV